MILKKLMLLAAAAAGMIATGAGVYAFQEPGADDPFRPGAAPSDPAKRPTGQPVQATTNPPPGFDQWVGAVPAGRQAEDLARKARELQEQKRFAEAHDVLRKLAIVVQDWEGQLRQIAGRTGGPLIFAPGEDGLPTPKPATPLRPAHPPGSLGRVERPGSASVDPLSSSPNPLPQPGDYYKKLSDAGYLPRSAARDSSSPPDAPGRPGPAASDQEQRIRRLEGLLEELLKEREGARGGPGGRRDR